MSVVNRMLQDIDRRQAAEPIEARGPYPDVRSVAPRAPRGRRNVWLAGGAVFLLAVGVIVAALWREGRLGRNVPVAAVPQQAAAALPAAATPLPAAVTPPASAGGALEPAASGAAAEVRSKPEPEPEPEPTVAPPVAARPPLDFFRLSLNLSPPLPTARSRKVASTPAATANAPAATGNAPTATANASTTTRTVVAVRQVAAAETVVAARQLWDEGSRTGAVATLREALAAAEASRDPQAASLLARELAGLELAGNRPQEALVLLRRHGGLLGEDADALALFGNAQQRLGMHSEAADAYLAALRMRPTEGKWMLGTAISLAATGRKDEAQAWADRARDRGAITPPISAYLQQLGLKTRP